MFSVLVGFLSVQVRDISDSCAFSGSFLLSNSGFVLAFLIMFDLIIILEKPACF